MTTLLFVHAPPWRILPRQPQRFWAMATGQHLIHPPVSPAGRAFEQGLQASGFFWPFLKTVNLVGGLSLLFNVAPAFGLALIAPVMATIVLFHVFLNPQGLPLAESWW